MLKKTFFNSNFNKIFLSSNVEKNILKFEQLNGILYRIFSNDEINEWWNNCKLNIILKHERQKVMFEFKIIGIFKRELCKQ